MHKFNNSKLSQSMHNFKNSKLSQSMDKFKNSKLSLITSLFSRREDDMPVDEPSIASTLEAITRDVRKEAKVAVMTGDRFVAPSRAPRPVPAPASAGAAAARKEKPVMHCHLTPDRYEDIIENSLSVLDLAGEIIDRNRAITAQYKKAEA